MSTLRQTNPRLASCICAAGGLLLLASCGNKLGGTVCGDDRAQGYEECDGVDLRGRSCASAAGHDSGELSCTPGCVVDVSGCFTCGDGVVSIAEQCDGHQLRGETCESQGFGGGSLGCSQNCQLDPATCTGGCGNNLLEPGEACDGTALGGLTCSALGYLGGILSCDLECAIDSTGCQDDPICGNGVQELWEPCDGTDIGGLSCAGAAGLPSGQLNCTASCQLDVSLCHACGNGVVEADEDCDTAVPNGVTCESLGFNAGTVTCDPSCHFDFQQCFGPADCGNGQRNPGEACDGTDFGGLSCSDLGFNGGQLGCSPNCEVEVWSCAGCGNAAIEVGEECDGTALSGATCGSQGHSGGLLTCSNSCAFDYGTCFSCGNGACEAGAGETHTLCPSDCNGWLTVSPGEFHTCGVQAGGTTWCWGSNHTAGIGTGTFADWTVPVQVPGLAGVVDTAAWAHTCALINDGTVWCWGYNLSGELGDGTQAIQRGTPVQVVNLTNAVGIAVADDGVACSHTCAVTGGGLVYCWGCNDSGQLGDGSNTSSATPVQVVGLSNATIVATGVSFSCAALGDSTAWCWGNNSSGELGTGNFVGPSLTPVQVIDLTGVIDLDAGGLGGSGGYACAALTDGSAYCWGYNAYGQLGNGFLNNSAFPQRVAGLTNAVTVGAGRMHTCASFSSGGAACWGRNQWGELGDGSFTDTTVPVMVQGLSNIIDIEPAIANRTCAMTGDNIAWCWGANGGGALGNGTYDPRYVPTAVVTP